MRCTHFTRLEKEFPIDPFDLYPLTRSGDWSWYARGQSRWTLDDRRVIDWLGCVNRLFDHNWRRGRLHFAEPSFLRCFLLKAFVFQFAGLFFHLLRSILGLADVFVGGWRRYLQFFSLGARRWLGR